MSEVIKLCGRARCCPTIEKLEEDMYIVKDDYDGEVRLTKENIELMHASLSEL